jgi:hypothetical protein
MGDDDRVLAILPGNMAAARAWPPLAAVVDLTLIMPKE